MPDAAFKEARKMTCNWMAPPGSKKDNRFGRTAKRSVVLLFSIRMSISRQEVVPLVIQSMIVNDMAADVPSVPNRSMHSRAGVLPFFDCQREDVLFI